MGSTRFCFLQHHVNPVSMQLDSYYRPSGSKIALIGLTGTCDRVRTLTCTQKLGSYGGMLPEENFNAVRWLLRLFWGLKRHYSKTDLPKSGQPLYNGQLTCPQLTLP